MIVRILFCAVGIFATMLVLITEFFAIVGWLILLPTLLVVSLFGIFFV